MNFTWNITKFHNHLNGNVEPALIVYYIACCKIFYLKFVEKMILGCCYIMLDMTIIEDHHKCEIFSYNTQNLFFIENKINTFLQDFCPRFLTLVRVGWSAFFTFFVVVFLFILLYLTISINILAEDWLDIKNKAKLFIELSKFVKERK